MSLAIKRIYEPVGGRDGFRVLVDRLWPRGISKAKARVDVWLPDVAPSTALRKWFGHDPSRWTVFVARYRAELRNRGKLLASLRRRANRGRVTLLYSARDEQFNQAVVLKTVLSRSRRAAAPRNKSGKPNRSA